MMAASLTSHPQLSLGKSSGRSRLSSNAVFLDSPYAADFSESESSPGNRQETRRCLGRNGQVLQGLGTSSDSDECSGTDSPSNVRRVTFSTGGAQEQPHQLWQQQQQQQQQDLQTQQHQEQEVLPAQHDQLQLPLGTRLWRGAAASVVAGQKLQSLERHAAQLKERQSIHTELRAWVEQVLQAQQDPDLIEPGLDDADAAVGPIARPSDRGSHSHAYHHHHQHHQQHPHHHPQQQGAQSEQHERHKQQHRHHRRSQHHLQVGDESGQPGDSTQLAAEQQQQHGHRRSSRHSRHHHRHNHAVTDGAEAEVSPGGPDIQDPAAAAAAAAQHGGCDAAATGTPQADGQQCQAAVELTTPSINQDPQQWQQFNPAEQQLISQLQADQQQLLAQLQQAYHQIAALTAAQQQQQQLMTTAGAEAGLDSEQQDLESTLHPSTDTQVFIIRDSTQADDEAEEDLNVAVQGSDSEQQQQQRQQQQQQQKNPSATTVSARSSADSAKTAKPSSTASTPRQRLPGKGAAAAQPPGTPRPPRASGLAQRGTPADTAAPQSPRKRLQESTAAAAGTAGKDRPKVVMPQGRGLTLPQQQALVTRLQQAEEVMDLLQQDLQKSLQAQELLQQQLREMSVQAQPEATTGAGAVQVGAERLQEQQLGQLQEQQPGLHDLQQQLQESLEHSKTVARQLDEASHVAAAQQELIVELQQQLDQYHLHHQQDMLQIDELQMLLNGAVEQLQALQSQQLQQQPQQQEAGMTSSSCNQPELHPWGVDALGQHAGLHAAAAAAAAAAAGGPVCCQHEARSQQLQSILQAALLQLQVYEAQQCSSMRPHTAAVPGSPRAKSTWQHRPVALHTWLYPVPTALQQQTQARPMSPYIPQQQQQQQQYQAGKLESYRSISAPRCATAGSARPWVLEDASVAASGVSSHSRCNTRGPLTARCASGTVNVCLQTLDSKLRPLTYRGPDRGAGGFSTPAVAACGRKPLSRDAQSGLLASLRVAPLSARGRGGGQQHPEGGGWDVCTGDSARNRVAGICSTSPESARGPVVQAAGGRGRDAVPRLALGGLQ